MGKIIDVESRPDLLHLVEELERAPEEEQLLRWRGRVVAIVRPASPGVAKAVGDETDAVFRAAAGSWNDHIDVDAFVEQNYRQRLRPRQRVVDV